MPRPTAGTPLKHFFEVPRDLWSRKGIQCRRYPRGLTGTLIIGDDTGLIKVVSAQKKKVIKVWGEQNPVKRIKKLLWAGNEEQFIAILSNGDIRLYDTLTGVHSTIIKQETDIQAAYVMNNPCSTNATNKRLLWTVNKASDARLWAMDINNEQYLNDYCMGTIDFPIASMNLNQLPTNKTEKHGSNHSFVQMIENYQKLKKLKNGKNEKIERERLETMERGAILSKFNMNEKMGKKKRKNYSLEYYGYHTKNDILCMKGHRKPNLFPWLAVAGDDRPVEVWDFNKHRRIFQGRHMYHYLGNKHPIVITDVDWCKTSVMNGEFICAAITKQSELKLYDVRVNKNRSVLQQKIGDYSLNKILISSQKKCLIGDSNANIWEFDFLKPSKERGYTYRRYRGLVGAIRDIAIHPTRNLIASVGLGRYLTIHRKMQPHLPMFKLYLKQKLNAVLFSSYYETQFASMVDENAKISEFIYESDSSSEDEEEKEIETEENVDEEEHEQKSLNEVLDGYDSEELKEMLNYLENEQKENDKQSTEGIINHPPLKKRKLNQT